MKPGWAALLGLACCCAQGAERVLDFHSEIRVGRDGALTVTEIITLQLGPTEPRAGLERVLPARRAEVMSVARNGAPVPYALEATGEGPRLRVAAPAAPQLAGMHEYRIVYRAARQVAFREAHDELAWNVNVAAWRLPIERLSAEVRFAEPVPAGSIRIDGRTGEDGHNFQAFVRAGSAAFRLTRPLAAGESFSLAVGFPKNVVAPPTRAQRFDAWAEGNRALLAGLGGLVVVAFWFQGRIRGQSRNS